jgi:hypothetical protein
VKITVNAEFSVSGFSSTNPTCNGYSNGSSTVNLSGGVPPFSYSWNTTPETNHTNGDRIISSSKLYGKCDRRYGCIATGNVTLTEPAVIGLDSKVVTPVTGCSGDTNGSIQALANGGTPDYTYNLYDGATLVGSQTPSYPLLPALPTWRK